MAAGAQPSDPGQWGRGGPGAAPGSVCLRAEFSASPTPVLPSLAYTRGPVPRGVSTRATQPQPTPAEGAWCRGGRGGFWPASAATPPRAGPAPGRPWAFRLMHFSGHPPAPESRGWVTVSFPEAALPLPPAPIGTHLIPLLGQRASLGSALASAVLSAVISHPDGPSWNALWMSGMRACRRN